MTDNTLAQYTPFFATLGHNAIKVQIFFFPPRFNHQYPQSSCTTIKHTVTTIVQPKPEQASKNGTLSIPPALSSIHSITDRHEAYSTTRSFGDMPDSRSQPCSHTSMQTGLLLNRTHLAPP